MQMEIAAESLGASAGPVVDGNQALRFPGKPFAPRSGTQPGGCGALASRRANPSIETVYSLDLAR